ncbi:MAG TPA: MarR family transcriptional regulator [Bacilli bacterium]|nr:MarR family transcriptional regulator [Bacilli bacterium]
MEAITEIMASFREIKRAYYRIIQLDAERVGVTMQQLLVLYIISRQQQLGLRELADKLHLGTSTMSGVVDRLVKAGLLARRESEEDRRAIVIHLTDDGEETIKEALGEKSQLKKRMEKVMEIPHEELQAMLDVHQRILEILQAEGE